MYNEIASLIVSTTKIEKGRGQHMILNMKKRLKNQKGLTLIELLAVIVILGIIAAIAVPSIGGIIDKSEKDAQVAEAIQIISAAKLSHASNSRIVEWTHNTSDDDTAAIGTMLSKVNDDNYVVGYNSTDGYFITSHEAAIVIKGGEEEVKVLESELLDYSK